MNDHCDRFLWLCYECELHIQLQVDYKLLHCVSETSLNTYHVPSQCKLRFRQSVNGCGRNSFKSPDDKFLDLICLIFIEMAMMMNNEEGISVCQD